MKTSIPALRARHFACGRTVRRRRFGLPCGAAVAAALLIQPAGAQQRPDAGPELPAALVLQLEALMADKAQRTPAQQKVSSSLLHAERIRRGEPVADGLALRQSPVEVERGGMVTVDVRTDVTPEILARIDVLGGSVIAGAPRYRAIRAQLPLAAVTTLAADEAVQWIRPADEAVTRSQAGTFQGAAGTRSADPAATRKVDTSEGDVAHKADRARRQYGVDGAGVGIGVISDGVDTLADRQASGDLPAGVTVLPGQARPADAADTARHAEGTAMLEIVHDLAPGADLYFATGFNGAASMATNIEALCKAGADVIVDDIGYLADAVFQDGIVARGVNAAVANGCSHFSSAGNSGNLNDGTAGVWEGDFAAGPTITVGGRPIGVSHLFGTTNLNRITDYAGNVMCLQWADPLGASSNDYDLYLLHPSAPSIVWSATNTQNGTQDPVECIPRLADRQGRLANLTNYRLLVVKAGGSNRYLHLNTHRGELAFATAGQTFGHAAAENAVGVAATDANRARGAGGVFSGASRRYGPSTSPRPAPRWSRRMQGAAVSRPAGRIRTWAAGHPSRPRTSAN